MKKKLLSLLAAVALVAGMIFIYDSRQFIQDYYMAATYQLDNDAATIASNLELTSQGMMLFKASRSQVLSADDFNLSCRGVHQELTIVLGCYSDGRIYIYDVTDERLDGAKEVTAAHEILHAAYDRLSASERQRVDELLETVDESLDEGRVKDTLALYKKATPAHLRHERYAIFGTEIGDLPDELEAHYAKLFSSRSVVVGFASQYNKIFVDIEKNIKRYDAGLAVLTNQKAAEESKLSNLKSQLQQSSRRLESLRSSNNISAYNIQIPIHNDLVNRHNSVVGRLRTLVVDYNEIVKKRNAQAVTQNDLVRQLDSTYEVVD